MIDREKKACPIAITHVSICPNCSQFGVNKNSYPAPELGKKYTRIAKIKNKIKNKGIKILFTFSIPDVEPNIKIKAVITITRVCQNTLPNSPVTSCKNTS